MGQVVIQMKRIVSGRIVSGANRYITNSIQQFIGINIQFIAKTSQHSVNRLTYMFIKREKCEKAFTNTNK